LVIDERDKETTKNLMLLIIQNFQDLSSPYKRDMALQSLRKMIVTTGY
jgi:hypothetical protein